MDKYTYRGEQVPSLVPTALYEGWRDGRTATDEGQLYRSPWWNKAMFRAGFLLATGRWGRR